MLRQKEGHGLTQVDLRLCHLPEAHIVQLINSQYISCTSSVAVQLVRSIQFPVLFVVAAVAVPVVHFLFSVLL